ncbi:hypothetical protein GCM10027444_17160 [Actinopolyspora lacussalsi]
MPPRMAGSGDQDETVAPAVLRAGYSEPGKTRETRERAEGHLSLTPVAYVAYEATSPSSGELSGARREP